MIAPVVDVEEVGEDADEDLSGSGRRKMPLFELLILAAQDFLAITPGEDAAVVVRVKENISVAGEKVARKADALDFYPRPLAHHDVDEGQADGNSLAGVEDAGKERIAMIVIVVHVAAKNEFTAEEIGHDIYALTVAIALAVAQATG